MRKYEPNKLLSFKCDSAIAKEKVLWRIYDKSKQTRLQILYIETTDNPDIIIVPSSIVTDLKDNSPHGYTGEVKSGYYRINKELVKLSNAHCVYNGEAYVKVEKLPEDYSDIEKLFNSTEYYLDKENKKGRIDQGMYEICKHLGSVGLRTVFSCNGHGKHKAEVTFSTSIPFEVVRDKLKNYEFISLEEKTHGMGHFKYLKAHFDFTQSNIEKLMSIGE